MESGKSVCVCVCSRGRVCFANFCSCSPRSPRTMCRYTPKSSFCYSTREKQNTRALYLYRYQFPWKHNYTIYIGRLLVVYTKVAVHLSITLICAGSHLFCRLNGNILDTTAVYLVDKFFIFPIDTFCFFFL